MVIAKAVWIAEGGMTLLFVGLVLLIWKREPVLDHVLWFMVWATRVLASLNGSRMLAEGSPHLTAYIGLQACSALSLLVIMMRSELRLMRQRLVNRLLVQLGSSEDSVPPAGRAKPGRETWAHNGER
jgi:hypothetical protein